MPHRASEKRASCSAFATAARTGEAQRAINAIREPETFKQTCTRDWLPSIVNVARLVRLRGSRNRSSILRASRDGTARRSEQAPRTGRDSLPFPRATGASAARGLSSEECDTVALLPPFRCTVAGGLDGACADAREALTCKAEYHACESARRSIAASGAPITLNPSCCVIMEAIMRAACQRAVAVMLPRCY